MFEAALVTVLQSMAFGTSWMIWREETRILTFQMRRTFTCRSRSHIDKWNLFFFKGAHDCKKENNTFFFLLCFFVISSWRKQTRCCGLRLRRRQGSAKPRRRAASSCSSWRPMSASFRTSVACWSVANSAWKRNALVCRLRWRPRGGSTARAQRPSVT